MADWPMNKSALILVLTGLVSACTHKEKTPLDSLPDMSAVRANLSFTCVHEADHLPPLDPEADQLFQYGRYLQKKEGPKNFNEVARYYRIAAAYGHYKANSNLQGLVSQGIAESPDAPKETIDLAAQLVNQGIPGGYYDIGHYLELGYGLKQDAEMALRYIRRPPISETRTHSSTSLRSSRRSTTHLRLPGRCGSVRQTRDTAGQPLHWALI